ncbi:FRG domain-containing protein [Microbulbifer sp. CnH-101-E]|uniref:FRG domain-containing protein n=1 Tax=unclassified Microbulbifer TaxID=2619833 RepID=UPI0040398417
MQQAALAFETIGIPLMQYCDTDIFGSIVLPDSIAEIFELAREHSADRKNVHLWRGQSDISWPIHSSAYRRLSRTNHYVNEESMQYYEEYLLKHATHQGYRFESGRELSDFELLAKLQHHGAATRLIDCSRNVMAALWFACSSEPDKTGLLFGIHSYHLGGGENKPETRKYQDIFKGLEKYKHPQTWQPPVVSKRIAAQGAQFLYSAVIDSEMGSLAVEKKCDTHIAIGISPAFKKSALDELAGLFDIRYLTLFPDIDGFGYANSHRFDQHESERW